MLVLFAATVILQVETGPQSEVDKLRFCQTLPATERTACLETASNALLGAIDDGTLVVAAAPSEATARTGFGLKKHIPAKKPAAANPTLPKVTSVEGKIVNVTALPNGRWRFSLDSGGQWMTTETGYAFRPDAGETVTIKRGALGSLRASFRGQQPLLVVRLK